MHGLTRSSQHPASNSLPVFQMMMCELSHLHRVRLFATLWTAACQAPLFTWLSRQEYWSGLPCPLPRDWTPVSYISCTGWVLYLQGCLGSQMRMLGCGLRFPHLCFSHHTSPQWQPRGEDVLWWTASSLDKWWDRSTEIQMHLQNETASLGHDQLTLFAKQHTLLIYKSSSHLINVSTFGPVLTWLMRLLFPRGNYLQSDELTTWSVWVCGWAIREMWFLLKPSLDCEFLERQCFTKSDAQVGAGINGRVEMLWGILTTIDFCSVHVYNS